MKSKYTYRNLTALTTLLFILFAQLTSFAQCPTGYTLSGTETVVNGNFSAGNTSFTSEYTYVADDPLIANELWPEGTYSVSLNSSTVHPNWSACNDKSGSGNFMMVNGNTVNNKKVWRQIVTVVPGTVYYFTTWICSVHNANPAQLEFSVNGSLLGTSITASTTTCLWQEFFSTWNSGSNTTADISIVNRNTTANGNDFGLDNISFAPCVVNLPINLLTFKPVCDGGKVLLYWATASEENNDYFTVEKSSDGESWSVVNVIKGTGNSSNYKYYQTWDEQPSKGIIYYRLKQTDFDGTSRFYGWTTINCDNEEPGVSYVSDPSSDELTIVIKNFKCHDAVFSVIDPLGRRVYEINITGIDNNFRKKVDFRNLSNGYYFFQFKSNDVNKISKSLKF